MSLAAAFEHSDLPSAFTKTGRARLSVQWIFCAVLMKERGNEKIRELFEIVVSNVEKILYMHSASEHFELVKNQGSDPEPLFNSMLCDLLI